MDVTDPDFQRLAEAVAGDSLINPGMLQKGEVERWAREDRETRRR